MSLPSPALRGLDSGPEVDSFYHLRGCSLERRACAGTACFVARNAQGLAQPNEEPRVYCLGRCFEAPAAGLGDARPRFEVQARESVLLRRIAQGGARTLEAYRQEGGYRALESALAGSTESVLAAVELSGLRGRGGAGFPTGRKWRAAAAQDAPLKFVVANADEGDAGAYSDRFILEDDPHALLEGMRLAAFATGATAGWIYLRHEYPAAETVLQQAIAEARAAGFLGTEVGFEIRLCVGHGSYVCGEESALLRSIEGRRPEVSARPPYPTEHGLFGLPTVTNNVETLASIPWIVEHGGRAYEALGHGGSRGTKLVSLNSLFARPGIYEIEFGLTLDQIVYALGGGLRSGELKGLMVGGPLAGLVPPHLLGTRFGFEELAAIGASVGHGGIVAFDQHTSIAALVRHVFAFGAYESCGKCTPCRLGARRVEDIFATATRSPAQEGEWREIVDALKWTSLCGHGGGLAAFAASVLRHYPAELEPCCA